MALKGKLALIKSLEAFNDPKLRRLISALKGSANQLLIKNATEDDVLAGLILNLLYQHRPDLKKDPKVVVLVDLFLKLDFTPQGLNEVLKSNLTTKSFLRKR